MTERRRASRGNQAVVGSGPNGLAAAIALARAGMQVVVREQAETMGRGRRCAELTLPGLVHDVRAAVHPLAVSSPLFRALPLGAHGLERALSDDEPLVREHAASALARLASRIDLVFPAPVAGAD